MERQQEEWMKMLSSCSLPKDQASPRGVSTSIEAFKPVNELPKRPTTFYKPNNDSKGLILDDLGFLILLMEINQRLSKLRSKGPESKNGFEESETLLLQQKGYVSRKLKMPLFDGDDSHSWIYKVERYFEVEDIEPGEQLRAAILCMEGQALAWFRWSEARSPIRSWEGLKRRLPERFQPSQEGTLYEQFMAITQEGSARKYVSLFGLLAG
ncbi:ankyrin repeat-containing protein [Tanacetum coccineum]